MANMKTAAFPLFIRDCGNTQLTVFPLRNRWHFWYTSRYFLCIISLYLALHEILLYSLIDLFKPNVEIFIYSSSVTALSCSWLWWIPSLSCEQRVWGRNTPWIGNRAPYTHSHLVASSPTGMILGGGMKTENLAKPMQTQGEHVKLITAGSSNTTHCISITPSLRTWPVIPIYAFGHPIQDL